MLDDDDEEVPVTKEEPRKWSWLWFFSIGLAGVKGWFTLIAGMLNDVEAAVDSHVDYKRDRKKFEQRASMEIEALTKELAPESPARVGG